SGLTAHCIRKKTFGVVQDAKLVITHTEIQGQVRGGVPGVLKERGPVVLRKPPEAARFCSEIVPLRLSRTVDNVALRKTANRTGEVMVDFPGKGPCFCLKSRKGGL